MFENSIRKPLTKENAREISNWEYNWGEPEGKKVVIIFWEAP